MAYTIAIPTYGRAMVCRDQTLSTLQKNGIPKEHIFVFVVEAEYAIYKDTLNPDTYGELVIGYEGLIQQREYIESYFQDGQYIVSMDDDIREIDLGGEAPDLNSFINKAFEDCCEKKSWIWGVYPVFNPFFRNTKKPLTTYRAFIIGCMYGYINRKDNIRVSLTKNKDDVERSIRYFERDGIVLRYNRVGVKTKMYSNGGLGRLNERKSIMEDDAIILNEYFPDITKIRIRTNGLWEIVLSKTI